MHYPMVLAAAVKFDHGDQQDDMGYISRQEGYFPTKKPETIDLETVVPNHTEYQPKRAGNLPIPANPPVNKWDTT